MKKKSYFVILSLMILVVGGCSAAETITVISSETLNAVSHKWAEAYMREHPGVNIAVQPGNVAATFGALEDGQTQIATVPRHIKYPEVQACIRALGKRPSEHRVGIHGVAVYVNDTNPVKALTLAELSDIFRGKVTNWKEVGGEDTEIVLFGTDQNSAAYESFQQEVLGGKGFSSRVQSLPGGAPVARAAAANKGAIGFAPLAELQGARTLGVKRAVSSTPVTPSEATIVDRTYPIMHYLYNYVKPGAETGEVKSYLEFVTGDEGQKIVRQAGYYPLPEDLRGK